MKPMAAQFAEFFCKVRYDDLPEAVVSHTKKFILDLIGVAIGGMELPFPQMMTQYLASLGGKPEATLLGSAAGEKIPGIHAALGNGVCAHALDMDDGYRYGGVHPSVATVPAAIAAGEITDSDGKALILGTVLGAEIMNRLAKAMNPSHLSRGFHTTGTLGPFGATVASGTIYGLSEEKLTRALGLAGLQSAGLLEILHDGAMTKPIHPGKAAMAGILSVELSERGAQGPASILEGKKGFFNAMADEVNIDALFEGIGDRFLILDHYVKLHAACRHVHPAIDAIIRLKKDHDIDYKNIDSIHITTYPVAISFCGDENLPNSGEAAKFNLSFSAALAAIFGDAGMDRFSAETVNDREIQDLAGRITATSDERWANAYPDLRGASVEMTTQDGKRYFMEVELAKGEPENPATPEDLMEKFRSNASKMPKDMCEALIAVIMDLENHTVSDLTRYFCF